MATYEFTLSTLVTADTQEHAEEILFEDLDNNLHVEIEEIREINAQ